MIGLLGAVHTATASWAIYIAIGIAVVEVEAASSGQSGTATEPIPLEHEGQQVRTAGRAAGGRAGLRGGRPAGPRARSALDTTPDRADALLADLRGDAKQAIGDRRRVACNLRPAALDELGLVGALGEQVGRFTRQGLSISLNAPAGLPVLPAAVEVAAYRSSPRR